MSMVMAVFEVASRMTLLVLLGTLPQDQLAELFQILLPPPFVQVQSVVTALTDPGKPKMDVEATPKLVRRMSVRTPACILVA